MTQTETLHKLIEALTDQNQGEPITREALREAGAMLGIFPEHRFRQAFHQTLAGLAKAGAIVLEDDGTILLIETLAELRQARAKPVRAARSASDPYGERTPPDELPAACDKLYALIEAAGGPVELYGFRGQMSTRDITCAMLELKRQGKVRLCASDLPGGVMVKLSDER